MDQEFRDLWEIIGNRYKSHPWHGVPIGAQAPEKVTVFIEVVPSDTVKYEIDKQTGYLQIDRPQKFSNIMPALYGFLPRTYCKESVAEYCMQQSGRTDLVGDGDPLDICVLTEKEVTHGNILVQAIPIGGFRMIDRGEADDKIVAVLEGDGVFGEIKDINRAPRSVITRLHHYFLTYKALPTDASDVVSIEKIYGREEALAVIRRAQEDYNTHYGAIEQEMAREAFRTISKMDPNRKRKNKDKP